MCTTSTQLRKRHSGLSFKKVKLSKRGGKLSQTRHVGESQQIRPFSVRCNSPLNAIRMSARWFDKACRRQLRNKLSNLRFHLDIKIWLILLIIFLLNYINHFFCHVRDCKFQVSNWLNLLCQIVRKWQTSLEEEELYKTIQSREDIFNQPSFLAQKMQLQSWIIWIKVMCYISASSTAKGIILHFSLPPK